LERIQSTGRALPCLVQSVSGQTVTVTFDVQSDTWTLPPVTIPIATSIYDWIPVQVGDKGVTLPADASLDKISGFGTTTPILGKNPANLSALMFVPCANDAWTAPQDPQKRNIQGPNGVFLQSIGGAVTGEFDKSAGITLAFGSVTAVINSTSITLTFGSDTIVMNSSGITITGTTINLDGNVVISGSLSSGGIGGANATFSGSITATGNVKAGAIDLETHVHTGVTTGSGNTGGPTG
jgi:hypothetical protein